MLDTRRFLSGIKKSTLKNVFNFCMSLFISMFIAFVPEYPGLEHKAVECLFILLFAAGLWVSEAIPAFATSLLVIALNIILLGFDDFDFAHGDKKEWLFYLSPWSSSLIFLFFAGFIMAAATSKTKLDLWIAKHVIMFVGGKPANILSGLMFITFLLSMFLSNTATTAMMVAVIAPIVLSIDKDDPFKKGILLGVVVAANIGGMGTIIGTPPNAIAVGALGDDAPSFIGWMMYALPPAVFVTLVLRFVILKLYPSKQTTLDMSMIDDVEHRDDSSKNPTKKPTFIPSWKKIIVIFTIFTTVILWLTGPLHHIPTMVVALLPVVSFTLFSILDVEDIRTLGWDVILMIAGGLSLGLAVSKTGLAQWLADSLELGELGFIAIMLLFSYIVVTASNFMSHTAAANIIIPIVAAFSAGMSDGASLMSVIAVALSASFAMALPISTPPNAIVYSFGVLESKDFLKIGIFCAIFAPICVAIWMKILAGIM